MEIVNFGSMNLDYVYTVPDFVRPGETLAADSRATYCGGKGLNQSVAAARAGAVVRHAGMLGQGGEALRAVLERSGVDTGLLTDCPLPRGTPSFRFPAPERTASCCTVGPMEL